MGQVELLFLVSVEKADQCYWKVGSVTTDCLDLNRKINYVECYRKDLVGITAALEIIEAINYHLYNIIEECNNEGFEIDIPKVGISYQLPLYLVEEVYDFWLEAYKTPIVWTKSKGLIKSRYRKSLNNTIVTLGLRGISKLCALKINTLSSFRPNYKVNSKKQVIPMW